MPAYYFHCTDGYDLIIDRRGRQIHADVDLERRARSVARRVMSEILVSSSWSRWLVCVHDAYGEQVAVVGFPEEGANAAAPVRAALSGCEGIRPCGP